MTRVNEVEEESRKFDLVVRRLLRNKVVNFGYSVPLKTDGTTIMVAGTLLANTSLKVLDIIFMPGGTAYGCNILAACIQSRGAIPFILLKTLTLTLDDEVDDADTRGDNDELTNAMREIYSTVILSVQELILRFHLTDADAEILAVALGQLNKSSFRRFKQLSLQLYDTTARGAQSLFSAIRESTVSCLTLSLPPLEVCRILFSNEVLHFPNLSDLGIFIKEKLGDNSRFEYHPDWRDDCRGRPLIVLRSESNTPQSRRASDQLTMLTLHCILHSDDMKQFSMAMRYSKVNKNMSGVAYVLIQGA